MTPEASEKSFLGPTYDETLRAVYTHVTPQDIATPRGLLAALTSDAIADNHPLFTLISQYFTQDLLARIAQEHRKGRLLLIGTTNLDARRPVVWNMGAIAEAAGNNPQALELFRRILLASAAIPGEFPPVMFDVEVDGQPYQEMHVDGGAMQQIFLYPANLSDTARREGIQVFARRVRKAYLIRNARRPTTTTRCSPSDSPSMTAATSSASRACSCRRCTFTTPCWPILRCSPISASTLRACTCMNSTFVEGADCSGWAANQQGRDRTAATRYTVTSEQRTVAGRVRNVTIVDGDVSLDRTMPSGWQGQSCVRLTAVDAPLSGPPVRVR